MPHRPSCKKWLFLQGLTKVCRKHCALRKYKLALSAVFGLWLIFHVTIEDIARVRSLLLYPVCFKFGHEDGGVRFLRDFFFFHPPDCVTSRHTKTLTIARTATRKSYSWLVKGQKGKFCHTAGHEGSEWDYNCSSTLSLTALLDVGEC